MYVVRLRSRQNCCKCLSARQEGMQYLGKKKKTQLLLEVFVIVDILDKKNALTDAKGYHKSLFTAMNADALATAFMVLGPAKTIELANELKIGVYLIIKNDENFYEEYNEYFEPFISK